MHFLRRLRRGWTTARGTYIPYFPPPPRVDQAGDQAAAQAGPAPEWCVCTNCRDMPTDREKLCCGQSPENCISGLPQFNLYCLDAGNLRIHRRYRDDVLVVARDREPGDDNKEFRYAGYRQYVFWQHGALGPGNRVVIAACCVGAIRDVYPDPFGRYTGYIPGH